MKSKPVLEIEVVSDVVCPWCYIGKKRLETAVAATRDQYEFRISYLPFELNPAIPLEGVGYREYLTEKFGGEEQFDLLTSRVSAVALQEGLIIDHARQKVSPNTGRLHAIIQSADDMAVQSRVVEGFFKAFFTDGIDLSRDENVIAVAQQAGMDPATTAKALADKSLVDAMRVQERGVYAMGIHSVPFYIINREFGITGAQPVDRFTEVFNEVSKAKA